MRTSKALSKFYVAVLNARNREFFSLASREEGMHLRLKVSWKSRVPRTRNVRERNGGLSSHIMELERASGIRALIRLCTSDSS